MRLRLWGKQLSIDGRIAIGVVVKGVTARVGVEHGLGCRRRLELEFGFGLWPWQLAGIKESALREVEFSEAHGRACGKAEVEWILLLDVSSHGGGVLIRVLGWAVDEGIGRREGRRGVTAERGSGSGSSHGGTMLVRRTKGMMRVGRSVRDVVVVWRRELRRAVGPIRAMVVEIHCGIEWKGRLRLIWDEMRGRICDGGRTLATKGRDWPWLMGHNGGGGHA
jgi:hypothetical protein